MPRSHPQSALNVVAEPHYRTRRRSFGPWPLIRVPAAKALPTVVLAAGSTDLKEYCVDLKAFLLIVAAALALPAGLFITYLLSDPRARWAAFIGALIGDGLTGLGLYYFVLAGKVGIDGLSYWFGLFFGCSIGVMVGALIANFLVAQVRGNSSDLTSMEG